MSKKGVLKRLNDVIWNERINTSEFEIEWQGIMDEYELNDNKWFKDMFSIRDKWIPAYFKDCHLLGLMGKTSRCKGENYFYGLMTNTKFHLIEYHDHFETTKEAQRCLQRKNNHDPRYTNPDTKTKLLIEDEVSEAFTRTVFFEIQKEIIASRLTCYSIKVEEYDGINKFNIKDNDKDVKHFGDFEVSFMKSDCTVTCSCLRFKLTGCLCRHCFYVLRMSRVEHFPRKYISRRWTKDVVSRSSNAYKMCQSPKNDANEDFKSMIRDIYYLVDYCVDRLVSDMEKLKLYREKLREMIQDVDEDTRNLQPMTNT
ncbi:protein FAR1-RELATED SEQUENCE 1-like [Lactuca sativa]|nr:protein FAR1-RELATED SEQUENCE 1-like [Lactuca sativa]